MCQLELTFSSPGCHADEACDSDTSHGSSDGHDAVRVDGTWREDACRTPKTGQDSVAAAHQGRQLILLQNVNLVDL